MMHAPKGSKLIGHGEQRRSPSSGKSEHRSCLNLHTLQEWWAVRVHCWPFACVPINHRCLLNSPFTPTPIGNCFAQINCAALGMRASKWAGLSAQIAVLFRYGNIQHCSCHCHLRVYRQLSFVCISIYHFKRFQTFLFSLPIFLLSNLNYFKFIYFLFDFRHLILINNF